jgi:hypothetical protein
MTWISKLSKTKKRWENHRKSIIGEIWWNGARKTNNHAVLGDLLEDGLLLSDVSAMSQRCLPSPPCRRGVCKMPLEGRDGFQTSDDWSWIHRVFIMISSRWTFHHFHLIRISWWILDESHDSSWLLLFFWFELQSACEKTGESAGSINQLRLLYQGVRWVWPFRSEVKQGFEPSFTSFLRHARRILKLKDIKGVNQGVNHCKLLEE